MESDLELKPKPGYWSGTKNLDHDWDQYWD